MRIAVVIGASVRLARDRGLEFEEAVRIAGDRYDVSPNEAFELVQEGIEHAE